MQESSISADQLNLKELIGILLNKRWTIIIGTFLVALASIIYSLMIPNTYRAEAVLAPVDDSSSELASLASKFGGLANLAGINLGGNKLSDQILAIEILKSRQFITDFIEKYQLAVPIIAAEGWDDQSDSLVIDPDIYNSETKTWVRNVRLPLQTIPTGEELHTEFLDMLNIEQKDKSGLYVISIDYLSPTLARVWVDNLILEINEYMRNRDINEAELSLTYLNNELENTSVAKLQDVFYQLIEEQMQIAMLAKVRHEYVFTTVDPATVPEKKIKPQRAFIVILSTMLGFIVLVSSILVIHKS